MPRRQITLEEILAAHAFGILGSIYKIMPGIVQAYTPGKKGKSPPLVDVQPAVHDVRIDTETGERVSEPFPVLAGVPVGRLRMGKFLVTAPLEAGDTVTLLSWDLDPTAFRGTGHPSDPVDTRRHGGSQWLALPFDLTDPGAATDPGEDLVVGDPDGVQVRVSSGGVSVGASSPSDAASLASKVDANFGDIVPAITAAIATLTGSGPATIAQVTAAFTAMKTALSTPGFAATGSGTVKITP